MAFSDGVFAIAVTLLVLDLRLPSETTAGGDAAVAAALLAMGPKLLIFAFTFIVASAGSAITASSATSARSIPACRG